MVIIILRSPDCQKGLCRGSIPPFCTVEFKSRLPNRGQTHGWHTTLAPAITDIIRTVSPCPYCVLLILGTDHHSPPLRKKSSGDCDVLMDAGGASRSCRVQSYHIITSIVMIIVILALICHVTVSCTTLDVSWWLSCVCYDPNLFSRPRPAVGLWVFWAVPPTPAALC